MAGKKVRWKISRERSVARTSLKSLAAFDIHTYCHRYDFFSHEERITSFLRCLQRSLRSQVQTSCYRLVTIKKELPLLISCYSWSVCNPTCYKKDSELYSLISHQSPHTCIIYWRMVEAVYNKLREKFLCAGQC